jgi:hypothetical protein
VNRTAYFPFANLPHGFTMPVNQMATENNKTAIDSALDFEARLGAATDNLCGHLDPPPEPSKGRAFETLQPANRMCRNRRMPWVFSLSASNGERAGVRCRICSSPVSNRNQAGLAFGNEVEF